MSIPSYSNYVRIWILCQNMNTGTKKKFATKADSYRNGSWGRKEYAVSRKESKTNSTSTPPLYMLGVEGGGRLLRAHKKTKEPKGYNQ